MKFYFKKKMVRVLRIIVVFAIHMVKVQNGK